MWECWKMGACCYVTWCCAHNSVCTQRLLCASDVCVWSSPEMWSNTKQVVFGTQLCVWLCVCVCGRGFTAHLYVVFTALRALNSPVIPPPPPAVCSSCWKWFQGEGEGSILHIKTTWNGSEPLLSWAIKFTVQQRTKWSANVLLKYTLSFLKTVFILHLACYSAEKGDVKS